MKIQDNEPKFTFAERLNEALKIRDMTAAELSRKTGISEGLISGYKKGKYKAAQSNMDKITKVLNVSITWMMGFDVPFAPRETTSTNNDTLDIFSIPGIEPLPETALKPLLGTIACGEPILAEENIEEMIPIPTSIHCDFALRCQGNSMVGARINDGDFVYVKCQPDVENGEIAAVLIDNEATLKRVYKRKNNQVELHPANPAYPVMVYTADTAQEIKILGKAIGCLFQIK